MEGMLNWVRRMEELGLPLGLSFGELATVDLGLFEDLAAGGLGPADVVLDKERTQVFDGVEDLRGRGHGLEEGGAGGGGDAEGGVEAAGVGGLLVEVGLATGDGAGLGTDEAAKAPMRDGDALDEDVFEDGQTGWRSRRRSAWRSS